MFLRKWLDSLLAQTSNNRLQSLVSAVDHFFYESNEHTSRGPHIRDAVDVKRWMILVVFALLPCVIVAIWNSGIQDFVYTSKNDLLMNEYIQSSASFRGYFDFAFQNGRVWTILKLGLLSFLPVLLISYIVGGFWEILFAVIRRHDISEGYLVTGILFPLALPSTIPYWMVVVGVSVGVILGKEVFGGTGMNILNPALTCRCFLYFAFPAYMTGSIWVGTESNVTAESILQMNRQAHLSVVDGYTQNSALSFFNLPREVRRVHVDAIASSKFDQSVDTSTVIQNHFRRWQKQHPNTSFTQLSPSELENFMTSSYDEGGLGLSPDQLPAAQKFVELKYGIGLYSNGNLFFGNRVGSMGEVSILACLLGAFLLLYTGIGSWRTMLSIIIGAVITALLFQWGSKIGPMGGAWNPAQFDFPAYKHFLMGSLVFGLIFMATDPVSSPGMNSAKWIYGLLIGSLIIIVRTINPAYPEGVMLAILFANVFAPLFDYYAVRIYRRKFRGKSRAET